MPFAIVLLNVIFTVGYLDLQQSDPTICQGNYLFKVVIKYKLGF